MRRLYFDYCASTPVAASVREAMLPFLGEHFGNPASGHVLGRAAAEAIEDARGQVAILLGCDAEELVFTSGGTESNNLALLGPFLARGRSVGGHLVISAVEHESVAAAARFLERFGYDVTVLPVSGQGLVQPHTLRHALRDDTLLVSIQHANHETGVVQPIRQLAEICHAANVMFHTDACQSAGKLRIQVDELEVDLLSIAGHKLYAPQGIGALFVRQGVDLEPLARGAGQEAGLRAGTENVAGIVGLGAAASLVAKSLDANRDRLEALTERLHAGLCAGIPGLAVHGELVPRLPGVLSLGFPGVSGQELLARVPELCAATGSSGRGTAEIVPSALAAMAIAPAIARGTIRLSLGWYTTEDEVDRAISLLLEAWEALHD